MQSKKTRILHIAAHLGEGVGKAIGGIALSDQEYEHEIILLEAPRKLAYVDLCRSQGIEVHISPQNEEFMQLLERADAVILSWWNHPLTLPVLRFFDKVPTRLLLWCHVNGNYYPRLPDAFAMLFDYCLFTSPISLELPYWSENALEQVDSMSEVVYGLGNFQPAMQPYKSEYDLHEPIRIGYVGTLDYAKMHPDFLAYCMAVLQRDVKAEFIMVGEPSEALKKDVKERGLGDKVRFLGYRRDVAELIPNLDIFGYLLNQNNFATTENVLLEAMAAGLPIVASEGAVERAIVSDGFDGWLAQGPEDYAAKIKSLAKDKSKREEFGKEARRTVCARYDSKDNLERFHKALQTVLGREKKKHDFQPVVGASACDGFMYFCPPEAQDIFDRVVAGGMEKFDALKEDAEKLGAVFRTDKKGSPLQFLQYYPEDVGLRMICGLFK